MTHAAFPYRAGANPPTYKLVRGFSDVSDNSPNRIDTLVNEAVRKGFEVVSMAISDSGTVIVMMVSRP